MSEDVLKPIETYTKVSIWYDEGNDFKQFHIVKTYRKAMDGEEPELYADDEDWVLWREEMFDTDSFPYVPVGRFFRVKGEETMMEESKEVVPYDPKADYYSVGGIETIDIIKAKLTDEEYLGCLKGNIIKYATRLGLKGDPKRDAEKISYYAQWVVDLYEGK